MKKFLLFLLVIISFCFIVTGCQTKQSNNKTINNNHGDTTQYIDVPLEYSEVLNDYKNILEFRFSENFYEEYNNGNLVDLSEKLKNDIDRTVVISSTPVKIGKHWWYMVVEMDSLLDTEGSINDFGYLLKDINNDSVKELFWVDRDYNILAIFTIVNGKAELVDAFWPRHRAVITNCGDIYLRMSGGADITYFSINTLEKNSSKYNEKHFFAIDGWDEVNNRNFFFEKINGDKKQIEQNRFQELLILYPFEKDESFKNIPINYLMSQ